MLFAGIDPNSPAAPGLADLAAHTPPAANITTIAASAALLRLFEITMFCPFQNQPGFLVFSASLVMTHGEPEIHSFFSESPVKVCILSCQTPKDNSCVHDYHNRLQKATEFSPK
jgi:hypothetical protein